MDLGRPSAARLSTSRKAHSGASISRFACCTIPRRLITPSASVAAHARRRVSLRGCRSHCGSVCSISCNLRQIFFWRRHELLGLFGLVSHRP